eukprot:jgi/Mesvir1/14175/Mv25148-RA.1
MARFMGLRKAIEGLQSASTVLRTTLVRKLNEIASGRAVPDARS